MGKLKNQFKKRTWAKKLKLSPIRFGCAEEATGQGTIVLEIASTTGKTSRSELHEALCVPVQFA